QIVEMESELEAIWASSQISWCKWSGSEGTMYSPLSKVDDKEISVETESFSRTSELVKQFQTQVNCRLFITTIQDANRGLRLNAARNVYLTKEAQDDPRALACVSGQDQTIYIYDEL